jgi:hypothetical protein
MGRNTSLGITPSAVLPSQLSGTTASRPVLTTSQQGVTFFNTDVNQLEIWNGSYWFVVGTYPNIAVTSSQAVGSNHAYWVNTTSNTVTLTLPSAPRQGDTVRITDSHGTFGTNACTVARNGKPIMRQADDMTINTPGASLALIFFDDTRGWLLEAI